MKAIEYIKTRKDLSNQITQYWNIIKTENVLPKTLKRTHDLKTIYTSILNLADQRALIKLKLQAINMGYKKFKDIPDACNQYDVFKLSELEEIKVQLERIPIIKPTVKAKIGKKKLNKTEEMTYNWVQARKKEIDLKINELHEKLTKFNDDCEFDDSDAPSFLTA